jgi:chromosome segregation ATPase
MTHFLSLILITVAAAAQSVPAPADPVAVQLEQLNGTLKQLVILLNRQTDLQDLDLLMKRVQLGDGRVAELERRLRMEQDDRQALEKEQATLEQRVIEVNAELQRHNRNIPATELESMASHTEAELKAVRQRSWQLAQEISAIQGELAARRDELRSWQSILDRRLAKQTG